MSSDDNRNSNFPPSNYQTELLLKQILDKVNTDEFKTGMERISSDVSSIKEDFGDIKTELNNVRISLVKVDAEIDKIKVSGESREKTLNEVHKAIYDPFTGIYSKLSNNESQFKDINFKLKKLEQQIATTKVDLIKEIELSEDELEIKLLESNKKIDSTEDKIKTLVDISGGEAFPDAKSAIDAHKNFNKLWWALILAVVSGFGKFVWDVVKDFN